MSETKLSPEPIPCFSRDGAGDVVCAPENRRRIAALWNACAGIPTEALEAGALRDMIERAVSAARALRGAGEEERKADEAFGMLLVGLQALGRLS